MLYLILLKCYQSRGKKKTTTSICFVRTGSPTGSTEGSKHRLLVYQHCIPLCESGDLQADVAADIIGLLMLEVKTNRWWKPMYITNIYVTVSCLKLFSDQFSNRKCTKLALILWKHILGLHFLVYIHNIYHSDIHTTSHFTLWNYFSSYLLKYLSLKLYGYKYLVVAWMPVTSSVLLQ